MKMRWKKIRSGLLAILTMVLLVPTQAFAAEGYVCDASIPVEVQITGANAPTGKEYTVVLETAEDEPENPMPESTSLVIKDSGKAQFGPITYVRPGDYHYTVYQKKGNTPYFTYDQSIFRVTVRVLNDGNGGLTSEVWATKGDGEVKTDPIKFVNTYQEPYTPTPQPDPEEPDEATLWKVEKVWNDAGFETSRPVNITIRLLCNGKVYDTVTVDASMNWSYGWLDLDENQTWTVEEEAVAGYVSSVTQSGKRFTITNTYVPAQQPDTTGNAASGGQTGDASATALWAVLLAGALAVAAVVMGKRRRA